MESTPILLIRMPYDKTEDEVSNVFLDFEESPIRDDYHIMVLKNYTPGETEIQFECISANHTEVQFEELKHRLLLEMEAAQVTRQKNKN